MDCSMSTSDSDSSHGGGGGCLYHGQQAIHAVATAVTSAVGGNGGGPETSSDDALLARELNELSFEERERVFDDIHGVPEIVSETPTFLENRLKEFDIAIAKLPRSKRQTLDRALFLKPSIESDTKFKLMFLRADDYDAGKAARRMGKYFEDKVKVFGEAKIVKKITLADFSKDDMEVFQSGPFLHLGQKDAAGRPIWLSNIARYDFSKAKSLVRCAWYMMMTGIEGDEAAQIKGVCNIVCCPAGIKFNVSIPQLIRIMMTEGEVIQNLPVQARCSHFCYDNAAMEFMLSGMRRAFGQKHRLRLRAHHGSGIEIQYKLLSYGIKFPFLLEGSGRDEEMELHQKFTQERLRIEHAERQQEEQLYRDTTSGSSSDRAEWMIPIPKPKDVLVGRGAPYQTYSGNIMLGEVIESQFLHRYSQTPDRFDKSCLHRDVVKAIQQVCGGRFIERTPQGWRVVDDNVARKKVHSSFRSKMAKYPSTTTNAIEFGKKIKQPFSTLDAPPTNFSPWGFGDGSAKRARYDPPNASIQTNFDIRNHDGMAWN